MESILLTILALIAVLLPFLIEKVISFFFQASAAKKQAAKNLFTYKLTIKENSKNISLLKELNFFKVFYTPA